MRTSTIVVDNFYRDPMAVREYALRQRFYYPYQADDDVAAGRLRFSWMTSWFKEAHECPFKSSMSLIEGLQALTGNRIDMEQWRLGFPLTDEGKAAPNCRDVPRSCLWNCSFHFKPE